MPSPLLALKLFLEASFFTFYAIRVVQASSEVLNDRKDDNKQYYLSEQSPAHVSSFLLVNKGYPKAYSNISADLS